jgi:trypsin-like peptidase
VTRHELPSATRVVPTLIACAIHLLGASPGRCAGSPTIPPALYSSFVVVVVDSPRLEATERPAKGSGVFVSEDGYILTVGHVVRSTVKDVVDKTVIPEAGSSVKIIFLDDLGHETTQIYDVDVVGYSDDPNPDAALLKVRTPSARKWPSPPLLDEDEGLRNCVWDCFVILGIGRYGFEHQPAGPTQVVGKRLLRSIRSATSPGFSGGPVYYYRDALREWTLVGMAQGGFPDIDLPVAKTMSVLSAATPLYESIRDNLTFAEGNQFPSTELRRILGGRDLSKMTPAQIDKWAGQRSLEKDMFDIVSVLEKENLSGIQAGPAAANLERLLEGLRRNVASTRPPSKSQRDYFGRLVERSNRLNARVKGPRDRNFFLLREKAVVQSKYCESTRVKLDECWLEVATTHQLMSKIADDVFENATAIDPSGEYDRTRDIAFGRLDHLLEWGDVLLRAVTPNAEPPPGEGLELALFYTQPPLPEERKIWHVVVVNAALDKYISAAHLYEGWFAPNPQIASRAGTAKRKARLCKALQDIAPHLNVDRQRALSYYSAAISLRKKWLEFCDDSTETTSAAADGPSDQREARR